MTDIIPLDKNELISLAKSIIETLDIKPPAVTSIVNHIT